LFLTEKEIQLFPPENVSPRIGIGLDEPKVVVAYQLNTDVCPHLGVNSKCKIYAKRPLMCRAFPYLNGNISSKCMFFSPRKREQFYNDIFPMVEMRKADEELNKYCLNILKEHFRVGIKQWIYDLATKKWTPKAQYDSLPEAFLT
jgi:Fe-S-cluster containining protein